MNGLHDGTKRAERQIRDTGERRLQHDRERAELQRQHTAEHGRERDLEAAFFWLVGLIVLVLFMIADFSRRNAAAAWLSAPYLLWLLFAAYLNLGIWLLNR